MSKEYDGRKELGGIVLFFFAIVLFLMYCLPGEVTGAFGTFVKSVCFGLLGKSAVIFPVFLVYCAIEALREKRRGISRIRVSSVIFIMILVSSLLCLFSMDFDYFRSLCSDGLDGKVKATKAVSLLWKSGMDSSLISNPAASNNTVSGGLIGGLVAVALYSVVGKVISGLTIIVLTLALVINITHVSLIRKPVKMASTAVKKVVSGRPVQSRGNGAMGRGSGYRGYESSDARYLYRNPSNRQPGQRTPFVNSPTDISNVPLMDVEYDPFNAGMPVDRKSGFVDVSAKEFGADTEPQEGVINYGTRQVSTKGAEDAPTADFGYTPTPKTHAIRPQRKYKDPSFLVDDRGQKDFYSLDNSVYPDADYKDASTIDGNAPEYSEDDFPYEMEEEVPYEETIAQSEAEVYDDIIPPRKVRVPKMPSSAGMPAESAIPINADLDKNADISGGRIVETAPDSPSATSAVYTTPAPKKEIGKYIPPRKDFLAAPTQTREQVKEQQSKLNARARELEETLQSFGIPAKVVNITHGPAITRFELTIEKGIKVSRVLALQDDIALSMAAVSVRIEAPIPGKSAIGIEIPNSKVSAVQLRGLLETKEFREAEPLEVPLGRDIPNRPIMCNIAKMPHLLIAGSTGSGKSVCINTILTSILYHASPDQVKMILIDPKVVELNVYNDIPHLYMPVVTDPKKAANALKWAVIEMEKRYKLFAENSVRDLAGYNDYLIFNGEKPLPLILIVIDELADLMTVASKEVEVQISRLAAMARAAGLHLIIATQRPSVDVLTGVIKANIPSRIAFAVSAGPDSRTILDSVGAEKLLGKGDMLYAPISAPKPIRGQGAFLSDKEVEAVVTYLKNRYGPYYDENIMRLINSGIDDGPSTGGSSGSGDGSDEDDLLDDAVNTVIEAGSASVSILQRRLGVGYPRAGKLIDALEKMHVIGPFEGSKPRKVLITKTEWLEIRAKQKG